MLSEAYQRAFALQVKEPEKYRKTNLNYNL